MEFLKYIKINKLIFGSILVSLIVVIVLLFVVPLADSTKCKLTHDRGPVVLKTLKSNDSRVLAKFSGYLFYQVDEETGDPTKRYIPLNFESVELTPIDEVQRKVTFYTNCATISMTITELIESSYRVTKIEIDLDKPNGEHRTCIIGVTTIHFRKPYHYACFVRTVNYCYNTSDLYARDKKLILSLQITVLEFEIDGDKTKFEKGEFSTEPKYCLF